MESNSQQDIAATIPRSILEVGYLKDNPPQLQSLSLAIYRLLLGGVPVTITDIASATGFTEARVRELLELIPVSAFDWHDDDSISAFVGLSLQPANHEFIVGGRTFHTWCVLDGLFIPGLIRKEATIETKCPTSALSIRVELSPERIISSSMEGVVMSVVNPDMDACCDDLRASLCNHVNFFASDGAFKEWAKGKTEYEYVTLERAFDMAKASNQNRYPDIDLAASPESPGT